MRETKAVRNSILPDGSIRTSSKSWFGVLEPKVNIWIVRPTHLFIEFKKIDYVLENFQLSLS